MPQLQIASHSYSSPAPSVEVVEGDIVDSLFYCSRCDGQHAVMGDYISCCCGDDHDIDYSCISGHYGPVGPDGSCGDYQCCQP